jgi:hypothetical protein
MEDEDTDSLMLTNLDMQTELAAVKEESSEEKPPASKLLSGRELTKKGIFSLIIKQHC